MDTTDSKMLEKAAELLSDFEFNEEELENIFNSLKAICLEESQFQPLMAKILLDLQEQNSDQLDFKNLTQYLNDETRQDLIQKFFAVLLTNTQVMEKIQTLTIGKFLNKSD